MEDKQKPLVGVTTNRGDADWISRHAQDYLDVLDEYGAQGVILAPDTPVVLPDGATYVPDALGRLSSEVLSQLDGLVLSGGGDIDPKYFDEELNGAYYISIQRDELELNLAKAAMSADMPVFGICRGMQVLNVAAGGGILQHIDNHRSPSRHEPIYHDVKLTPSSYIGEIIGQSTLAVNTFHHQGVNHEKLAPSFMPTGIAHPDEWLIESFESPVHRWLLAVQWHPERLYHLDDAHRNLWIDFVKACS